MAQLFSLGHHDHTIMIRVFIFTLFVCYSAFAADDMADAKAAFTNLITYQKTDDIRSLDLFAKHCIVTFRIVDGTTERLAVMPLDVFRESLKKGIAQKKGSDGDYEDVRFSSDGFMVKVNANIHYTNLGKTGPFFALYGRDRDGVMKIEEFRVTIFSHEHAH